MQSLIERMVLSIEQLAVVPTVEEERLVSKKSKELLGFKIMRLVGEY